MKRIESVFCIVSDCHTGSGHYRSLWRRHFYEGIQNTGIRVALPVEVDFSWARDGTLPSAQAPQRTQLSERLGSQIRAAQERDGLDAVISYCFAHDLDPSLVRETIRSGIPWINFYCDSTHRFGEIESLARSVSLNWFPETAAIETYSQLGVPWLCRPYALNPAYLPDCHCETASVPVSFIGLPTANRITQLGFLRLLGRPVSIRGYGWTGDRGAPFHNPERRKGDWIRVWFRRGLLEKLARRILWPLVKRQAHAAIPEDELADYLRQCRVVLGLNQGRDEQGRLASYLKFRDVEFPGYGCCYLTEENEDIAAAFELNREVLTFRNLREAAATIAEMLRNPSRAQAIGVAGRRRVLADHTWEVRLRQLAEAL